MCTLALIYLVERAKLCEFFGYMLSEEAWRVEVRNPDCLRNGTKIPGIHVDSGSVEDCIVDQVNAFLCTLCTFY